MEHGHERTNKGRPKRLAILLACAERIGSRIDCVADELRSRGHDVDLQTGRAGKDALKATKRLRVLCVREALSLGQLDRLELALDADGERNLLVVTMDRTAAGMANRIESFGQQVAQRRRAARATRSIVLPIARKPANPKRWLVPASAAGAALVAILAVFQFGGGPVDTDEMIELPLPTATKTIVAPAVLADPEADAPIRVSVITDEPADSEIQIFDEEERSAKPARKPRPATDASKAAPGATPPPPPHVLESLGEGSTATVSVVSAGNGHAINLGTAALLGNEAPKPPPEEETPPI